MKKNLMCLVFHNRNVLLHNRNVLHMFFEKM